LAFVRVVVRIKSNHHENVQDRGLLYCPYNKCKATTTDMASMIWTIVMAVLGIIVLIILLSALWIDLNA
jgi:hypothetical protein